jgi:outer membrane protein assembly factor BamB
MKQNRNRVYPLMLAILFLVAGASLVACGGGGDGNSPFAEAENPDIPDTPDNPNPPDNPDPPPPDTRAWNVGISIDPLILRGNPLFGFQLFSSPAVEPSGTIYVGSTDGILYAVAPNGIIEWRYETGDQIVASPAIGSDGTIYVGSSDRQLYAINPDGTLKWVYPTKSILSSSPAIATDGTIYVAGTYLDGLFICGDPPNPVQLGALYAVNPNGTSKWSTTLSGPVNSSPVIASDGTIYIGSGGDLRPLPKAKPFDPPPDPPQVSYDRTNPCDPTTPIPPSDADPSYPVNGHVYAINPDGTIKWDFKALGNVDSSAAIAADGTIYIGSDYATYAYKGADTTDVIEIGSRTTGFLYAIDPDEGTSIWYTDLFGDVKSSPAIGGDGTIYVGSDKGDVFALNPDGAIKWVFPTRGAVRSSAALAADGTIYIGSNDSRLYVLNPDGTLNFQFLANAAIASSPSIIADGTIYFATGVPASDEPFVDGDATLYSIDGNTGLADTDWPKFRRNLPNIGRQ